jgi:uncharacterized membrane protein YbhN (UPF0104 family)
MSGALHWIAGVLEPLMRIDPRWALLALALQLANLACRATTWRNVLAGAYPEAKLPVYRVGLAYAVGCALNGFLPARGGEAVKVALVRLQVPETSTAAVASSCSVVLVFDSLVGLTVLTVGWLTGAISSPPGVVGLAEAAAGSPLITAGAAVLALGAAWFIARHAGPKLRSVAGELRKGIAVLRNPLTYIRSVVSIQALAWCCRIGVTYCLLHAFGIAAPLALAALVVVVGGMSTAVPVPGGAGTQQALAVFVLSAVASTSSALSFSIGTQIGVTLVNTLIGITAAMLVFGRLHPVAAIKDAIAARHPHPVADVIDHLPVAAPSLEPALEAA